MAHPCISANEDLGAAMKKCPFLHNIAQTHGEEYATSLACKTPCPTGLNSAHRPLLAEDYDCYDFSSTFALFHGRGGVLPLPHLSISGPKVLYPLEQPPAPVEPERPPCPFSTSTPRIDTFGFAVPLLAAAPLASMSMSWGSNWFNIHHLFQKHINQHRAQQRKPPQQPQQPSGNHPGGFAGPGLGGPGSTSAQGPAAGGSGKCPLRKALGPLAGVVFNKSGHLSCPEPIVKMRAVLAATRPVRELRPQALPIKLLAVAMTTAALNVPCGMWREHTEKFSSQWFIAVHATIPFVAMLRKAVIMPKYAILFTICAAIAGQAMGAKLERRRMMSQAKDELGGLAKASAAVAAYKRTAAAAARQSAPLPVASLLMSAQPLDRPSLSAQAATHGIALWTAMPGDGDTELGAAEALAAPLRINPKHQQQKSGLLQFRVSRRLRSGRGAEGSRRGVAVVAGAVEAPSSLSIGRDPLVRVPAPPVTAMVPAITC